MAHASGSFDAAPPAGSLFHNRNFSLLLGGLIVSNSGGWMQNVAQGWLVYELTDSPVYLGIVGVSRAVAMVLLPPIGGVLADRMDRLRLLKATRLLGFVLSVIMGVLVAAGVVEIWQILILSFLSGVSEAFDAPARTAMLPNIVPPQHLGRAIALNSAAWQGSALVGPSVAGVLIASVGVEICFFANAAGFLAVVAALYLMRDVPSNVAGGGHQAGVAADFLAGLRHIRASPLVTTLLALSLITAVFGRSYLQLMPVFARDVLDAGSSGLGVLTSVHGAGTIAGAVLMSALGDFPRKGLVLFQAMLVAGGAVAAFTLSRSLPASLVILFVAAFASITFTTMLTTMLQLAVPDEMRGRIMSLTTVFYQGFTPFGALVTGAVATEIGTPDAVMISALVVCAAALVSVVAVPMVRNFTPASATKAAAPA